MRASVKRMIKRGIGDYGKGRWPRSSELINDKQVKNKRNKQKKIRKERM